MKSKKILAIVLSMVLILSTSVSALFLTANADASAMPIMPTGNTNYSGSIDRVVTVLGQQSIDTPNMLPETVWNTATQTLTLDPTVSTSTYNYNLRTFYSTTLGTTAEDYAIEFDVTVPTGDNRLEVLIGAGPNYWTAGPCQILFFTGPGGVVTRLYDSDIQNQLADTGLGHGLTENALNHVTILLKEGRYLTVWVNDVLMNWGTITANGGYDIGAGKGSHFGIKANYSSTSGGLITVNNIKQYKLGEDKPVLPVEDPNEPQMPTGNTNYAGSIDRVVTVLGQQSIDTPNMLPETVWNTATQTLTLDPTVSTSTYNYNLRTFSPTTLATTAEDYAIEFDVTVPTGDNRLEVLIGAGPNYWTAGPCQILFLTGPGGVATRLYDADIQNQLADTGLGHGLTQNELNHVTILMKEGRYLTVWVNDVLMNWGASTTSGGYDIGADKSSHFGIKANQNSAVGGLITVNNIKQYKLVEDKPVFPVVSGIRENGRYTTATITFNEGTAKLNGASFNSGDTVNTQGNYILVVTDSETNATTIHFSIVPAVVFTTYKATGSFLTNIGPDISANNFPIGLLVSDDSRIELVDKDENPITGNTNVGTGMIMNVYVNEQINGSYTIKIFGDVDGDGSIDINDMVSVRNHLLEVEPLSDPYQSAGDLYGEGNVTLNGLVGMMSFVSENGTINQNR